MLLENKVIFCGIIFIDDTETDKLPGEKFHSHSSKLVKRSLNRVCYKCMGRAK